MQFRSLFISAVISLFIFTGCGEEFDINQFNNEGDPNIGGDTLYVQLNPAWTGFNSPQDLYIGREPFIYVADTDNDRIIMMNLAGQILGSRSIKKPVAIAQDYQLNLIVCASFDTLGKTFSCVYKLDLYTAGHIIETAPIKQILPRPNVSSDLKETIQYTGVCAFYDNSFYIARTGPNNSSIFDPDNSILIFQKKITGTGAKVDTLIGRFPSLQPLGTGLMTANQISSLTSFNRRNNDVILTLKGNTSFKSQWLYYNFASETPGYENKLTPGGNDIMRVDKFIRPEGAAVDASDNIFVADAGKDSVFKFNSFGDELQSFGGPNIFNQPYAVAVFDRTLYVLDSGNNRILRFILSTDL